MTEEQLQELVCRQKVSRLIQQIILVLRAARSILPTARWYASKVQRAYARGQKIKVSLDFHVYVSFYLQCDECY